MKPSHDSHPLMPGIRSDEIHCTDWPRTLHDKQLTGFSPLPLGMVGAPEVWQHIDVPGEYRWIRDVDTLAGPAFLVEDGRLTLYDVVSGVARWRAAVSGELEFWGDLFGDGRDTALVRRANRLWCLDGVTGETRWEQTCDPPHVDLRVCVGRVLADGGSWQAAVFEQYGDAGWLLDFERDGDVREVWHRQVIANDVWPVRADHGCDVAFDLEPDPPVLWNVRHHRCQSFDAATGEPRGCLQYELDGAFRRNYGPWRLSTGAGGQRCLTVASEMVQTHVHGLHLHPDGTPELAWQRYYGEVYVVPGVAVEFLGVGDLDGDGADEILYNVRDPEQDLRSFVRARDVATGHIKYEWGDHWCSGWVADLGVSARSVLLMHPAPEGATPEQGPMHLISLDEGLPKQLAAFDHAGPWGTTRISGPQGGDLLLRVVDEKSPTLALIDGTSLESIDRLTDSPLLAAPIGAARPVAGDLFLAGSSSIVRWGQKDAVDLDLAGGAPPTLSAAATGEGEGADLFAHTPGQRLHRYRLHSTTHEVLLDQPFLGETARYSPLLYDLDGDGTLELVIPGATPQGQLTAAARREDGSKLWQVDLPDARTDDGGKVVAWNAGDFLLSEDGPRPAVAISIYSDRRIQEGTFLLDGQDGRVVWFRGVYHDGEVIRGYRPVGLPGAFDWDGDGAEEIAWDMYSYMAFLRGDGEFAAIFGGPNVRPEEESVPAISLYNGFTPVYRGDEERPHWFVHHGHGRFGLTGPDPRQGIWHEEEGYDTPDRIGFIDVDGDGSLEAGYALRNDSVFRCRDLWTGDTKWCLELPSPPAGPVLCADVDGDGRGEFLVDRWCIGVNEAGIGEIRWTAPVSFGWAVIADFDGDGLGEIACSQAGRVTILKQSRSTR